jgi:dCMP deaminase
MKARSDAFMRTTKWDVRFLQLSQFISKWSLDPSTKVGAVIVDDNRRVVSVGYNGLPMGIADTAERLNDRELKYKIIVHGERNAMLFAGRPLTGCTLYTWPFMPCSVCSAMIIQAGIKRVVSITSSNARWKDDFTLSSEILEEAGVQLELLDAAQFGISLPGPTIVESFPVKSVRPWYKRWFG